MTSCGTRTVSFEGEKDRLAGFLARPEGEGPSPGVVVIHEASGLNENIRDVALRLAAHGHAAFAVDMFAGRNRAVCMARFMGGMLRGKPRPFGVGDLERALSVLGGQPGVDAERLGAIGFCMGGGYALAWACNDDRLRPSRHTTARTRVRSRPSPARVRWSVPIPKETSPPGPHASSTPNSRATAYRTT